MEKTLSFQFVLCNRNNHETARGMAAITCVVGKWEPDTALRDRRVFGATMERNAKHPKCPLHSVQLQIL